jgi:GT2 family glycosyltransferase
VPEVSIVVLTYNNLPLTTRMVDSIRAKAGSVSYELIFVDSGSTDGSLEYFATLEGTTVISTLGEPFIFNRNLNKGIAAAKGEIVICANNDVEVLSDNFLAPMVQTLRDNRLVGVLAIELCPPYDGPIELVLVHGYTQGCFYAMRRSTWEEIGGLSEQYGGYGCEEADVSVRLLRSGYRTGYLRGIFCHHVGNATFGQGVATYEACLKNALVFEQLHGYSLNFADGTDFWDNLHGYIGCVFDFEWRKRKTKLEIGCGGKKEPGYIGIDQFVASAVDLVWDLNNGVPFPDSTVDEVRADNVLEHLPDSIRIMNDIYRVLKPDGLLHAIVPSTDGRGAWQDPTHKSFWNDNSWGYYCENAGIDSGYRQRIGMTCRFRIEKVETITTFNVPYSCARLRATK